MLYVKIMITTLQERGQFTTTLQFGTQIYSHASQRQQWRKNGRKLTKVRNKNDVIAEARTKGAEVHFASLTDICHVKKAELEAKHHKNKGRVVLQGATAKDDSGSCAEKYSPNKDHQHLK